MHATEVRRHEIRRRAAELALAGRHSDAACLYAELVEHGSAVGEIALRLGEERRRCGNLEAARSAFEKAVAYFEREGRADQAEATKQTIATLHATAARPSWFRRVMSRLRRSTS